MTTDLQTIKATAQATAEKCPELLVTVPAGVMVELIRDVERYRFIKEKGGPICYQVDSGRISLNDLDHEIDSSMAEGSK